MKSFITFRLCSYFLIWLFFILFYNAEANPLKEITQAELSHLPLIKSVVNVSKERMEKDRVLRNAVIENFKWELTKLTEEEKILYDYMEAYSTEVSTIYKLVHGECLIITDKNQQECRYVTQRCFFQNVSQCLQSKNLI